MEGNILVSLTQLEYILAVEKFRHFGKAAQFCNISQPTLSQQIQKVEDSLSIIIFDRLQKPIIPTEEGEKFISQSKEVILAHQKLIYGISSSRDPLSGVFRLGIIPTVSNYLIPLFINDFSIKFPKITLHINELNTENIIRAINEDIIDGAVLATPLKNEKFKEHPLYYESFLIFLAKGEELLNKNKINQKDIDGAKMWMLQDGNCFKSQIAQFCSLNLEENPLIKNIRFQSGSLDTLCHVIKNNSGYTLIPELLGLQLGKEVLEQHVREFEPPIPTREISFVYRRDHWKINIIKAIKQTIQDSLPTHIQTVPSFNQKVLEIC